MRDILFRHKAAKLLNEVYVFLVGSGLLMSLYSAVCYVFGRLSWKGL